MSAVGTPLDRVDGRRKITGAARYATEFAPDGLVHAVVVQSTVARGLASLRPEVTDDGLRSIVRVANGAISENSL